MPTRNDLAQASNPALGAISTIAVVVAAVEVNRRGLT